MLFKFFFFLQNSFIYLYFFIFFLFLIFFLFEILIGDERDQSQRP